MDEQMVDWLDFQVRNLLTMRMADLPKLKANHMLLRDTGEGWRRGNLASESLEVIQKRLFADDFHIEVMTDDPDFTENAGQVSLLANSMCRVTEFQKIAYKAASNSFWAGYGVLSVGHPLDPFNLDIRRSARVDSAKVQETIDPTTIQQDEWEPVDPQIAKGYGGDNIIPFDAFAQPANFPSAIGEPQPVFNPSNGLPWVESVDPRLVLFNRSAKEYEEMDFVVRLHFLTVAEIEYLTGINVAEGSNSANRWADLFSDVTGNDMVQYPDMILVAQVFISRNRAAPHLNDWHIIYLPDRTDMVLRNEPNPMGGFCPLSFVKLRDHAAFHDMPEAERLGDYATMFDLGIQSLYRRFKDVINPKALVPQSAGIDQQGQRNLMNEHFRGAIPCKDPTAVQFFKTEGISNDLLLGMGYFKTLAQGTSHANDIERGTAIKGITARQTQSLMQSTEINISGMKDSFEKSFIDVVMKLMWITGKFNYLSGKKSVKVGGKVVVMDAGSHDFVKSLLYGVKIRDTGDMDVERQMAVNQLLRTISASPQLASFFDLRNLAIELTNAFGLNPRVLAHLSANPQPEGQVAQGTPGFLPGGQNQLDAGKGTGLGDLANGQHPERAARGAGISNVMEGANRIGVGQ